jgi:TatD DNase family protein
LCNISLDRIVLETDAPYLSPVPHRGKRNEPAFMADTAKRIAEIYQIPLEELAETTTNNVKSLFKI